MSRPDTLEAIDDELAELERLIARALDRDDEDEAEQLEAEVEILQAKRARLAPEGT